MAAYSKIIPFINCENEMKEQVLQRAFEYRNQGADELFLFNYSSGEPDSQEFLELCRETVRQTELPVLAGVYVKRFEDVKKAFYTGADRVVIKCSSSFYPEAIREAVGRFGADHILLETDYKSEFLKESFRAQLESLGNPGILLKHVETGGQLEALLSGYEGTVLIRDALIRNNIEELFALPGNEGVSTDYYLGKDLMKIKKGWKEKGIAVNTFESTMDFGRFKTDENGLVPCIVQDCENGEVLMLAYMNQESFQATLDTGKMTYWSRSRQELWCKGDTSGHCQYVKSLSIDCDADTILAKVRQVGAACHTGNRSCFYRELAKKEGDFSNPLTILNEVYDTILDRKKKPKEGSYTNYLFDKGIDKILKKCGEEATEIVIAAKNPDAQELKYEIADFLYHMMVLMAECGLDWQDITKELSGRH